ncbi:MAG: class I SAM-dependent methyltransferase [Nevskia sp.]|nr:class I SAM-dependent methyltransferase [Nevskia sp.]
MPTTTASERISPTAYATGYFWYRHGLSHPALATVEGRRIDRVVRPLLFGTRLLGGFSLTALMLARHRGIDRVLGDAIGQGRVGQVIEIAAGLSPRGWDMKRRFGERLRYIETDLPHMVALKQRLLSDGGLLTPGHSVLALDALADSGPDSLHALARTLDPAVGTAIVTEGLMNYLDPEAARDVWRRIAAALRRFPHGVYLNDLYLRPQHVNAAAGLFGVLLQAFVRGRMHVHFRTEDEVQETMRNCGFANTLLHYTRDLQETRDYAAVRGGDAVMVLEARV